MKHYKLWYQDVNEIIIDTREYINQPYIISLFSEDFVLVKKEILVGDYMSGRVLFEHKTCINLIQDIFNGHLLQQCQDLAYNKLFGYVPNIIMSCNLSDVFKYDTSLSEDFLLGTISSITYHYGIPTTFLSNERMIVKYIEKSCEKGNIVKLPTISPIRKPVTTENLIANHYSTIPVVGVEISKNLAERFPVPSGLYTATIKELQNVPLVGKKRAKDIYTFLHG